jgi:hypothetical protein
VTGLNCEAPVNQPLHELFVARLGVDLPLKLYKAKAAAGQRFKVRKLQVNAKAAAAAAAAASRNAAAPAPSAAGDGHLSLRPTPLLQRAFDSAFHCTKCAKA